MTDEVSSTAGELKSMSLILGVLAGGLGSRFIGGSKVEVRIGDEPIIAWQARRLGPMCGGRCWLSLAPGQNKPSGSNLYQQVVVDRFEGIGPLAGIAALLENAGHENVVLIIPADMPLIESCDLERLIIALEHAPDCKVVMGRWSDGDRQGTVEPFPSAWRGRTGLALVQKAMAEGLHGPHRLGERSDVLCVPLTVKCDGSRYQNINREEDMAAVQNQLGCRVWVNPLQTE